MNNLENKNQCEGTDIKRMGFNRELSCEDWMLELFSELKAAKRNGTRKVQWIVMSSDKKTGFAGMMESLLTGLDYGVETEYIKTKVYGDDYNICLYGLTVTIPTEQQETEAA